MVGVQETRWKVMVIGLKQHLDMWPLRHFGKHLLAGGTMVFLLARGEKANRLAGADGHMPHQMGEPHMIGLMKRAFIRTAKIGSPMVTARQNLYHATHGAALEVAIT